MIYVSNWFLWCKNEIQVLSQVFLMTPTLYAVTAEVTELNNRKNLKNTSCMCIQPGENHETRIAKSEKVFKKITGSNKSWKLLLFFSTLNRGGWNIGGKRWGKQSYLATSREDIREAHTILAYCFTDSLCSREYISIDQYDALTQNSLLSFLSILAHFPKPKF